ncbi:MAG: rhombosortase [Pseudomonadota bacterium]
MRTHVPVNQAPASKLLRSLNGDGRHGMALLLAVGVLLLPLLGGQPLRLAWRYQRDAVGVGEFWRLLTAHIVHLDVTHALLNAVGLVLLWGLFARVWNPLQWLFAMLVSLLAIDVGFWFLAPQLQWYVGASGLLHGVFACGCIALLRQRDWIGAVSTVVFIAKLIWEQRVGPLPFEENGTVVTVAHLYGAVGGFVAGLLMVILRR